MKGGGTSDAFSGLSIPLAFLSLIFHSSMRVSTCPPSTATTPGERRKYV